jgi:hypothetical protein
MRGLSWLLLTLAAAPTLAACATRAPVTDREAALLSTAPPPLGRECHVVPLAAAARDADQLLHSARLLAEVRTLEHRPHGGYVLFSLYFDENGWNQRRDVIDHNVSPELADSVRTLLFHHVRELEGPGPIGARLRVDLAPEPALRTGSQEVCPARLRSRRDLIPLSDPFDVRNQDPRILTSVNSVWVTVDLDPQGWVTGIRFERGQVRLRTERHVIAWVRQLEFEPTLLDGVPVASTTQVPVRVR